MLVDLSLHILLILIEYKPPSLENLRFLLDGKHHALTILKLHFLVSQNPAAPRAEKTVVEDLTLNEIYRLTRVIHGKINLDPLYIGLSKFFENVYVTKQAYLPNSWAMIPFFQEVTILLWRFLTINKNVLDDFVVREDFHPKYVLGILVLLDQSKKDPTKSNLLYLCIFFLLTVSASRELALSLNEEF